VQLGEAGIEAPVEADQHLHAGLAHLGEAGIHAGEREVDRLLAEDRLAGPRGGDHQIRMCVGGGGDDHRADLRIGQSRLRAARPGAVFRGQRLGRLPVHIHHMPQRRAAARREVCGVDAANAAGAELCEVEHGVFRWRPLAGAVIKP
jgi:hypothetical protein